MVVAALLDFLESERLMVPLGLTRPVPCTRPPARGRMVLLRLGRPEDSLEAFGSEERGDERLRGKKEVKTTYEKPESSEAEQGLEQEPEREVVGVRWARGSVLVGSGESRPDTRRSRMRYPSCW